MGRKKKEINKDGAFQVRFRELWSQSKLTQEALAAKLGVSRPTVVGWLDGKNIPDIISLTRIAKVFNVSADYLLGLSDTVSPDVNTRVAVEYTGLSEVAVECLHAGFDDPEHYGFPKTDIEKKSNLRAASALIASHAFEHMIGSFGEIEKWAYLEKLLLELRGQRIESDIQEGKTESLPMPAEEFGRIMGEIFRIFDLEGFYVPEYRRSKLEERIDECLNGDSLLGLLDIQESLDRYQFVASKAIMEYLDKLVNESRQRANRSFEAYF